MKIDFSSGKNQYLIGAMSHSTTRACPAQAALTQGHAETSSGQAPGPDHQGMSCPSSPPGPCSTLLRDHQGMSCPSSLPQATLNPPPGPAPAPTPAPAPNRGFHANTRPKLAQNKRFRINGLQYEPKGAKPTVESSTSMVSQNLCFLHRKTPLTRSK